MVSSLLIEKRKLHRMLSLQKIEAKFIGFSMYTTCVIWLAFAAVYFAIDVKVFSLCVATNASAYVVLIFLFFPKLYLIIFKPERNHRR